MLETMQGGDYKQEQMRHDDSGEIEVGGRFARNMNFAGQPVKLSDC